ncbi:hypothetical protein B0H14DRAFT_2409327 [Mycena olivaceomarginata]|nr:hypothetical protein B0H14DRAFT_2409327 [Mycena olivaceomarginata]
MNVDFNVSGPVDPSLFTDSHFLAAAHTFQDHLFSDWLSDAPAEKVEKYENTIMKNRVHSSPTRAGCGYFMYTCRFS